MSAAFQMLLWAWLIAAVWMLVLWVIHLAIHNAGVVDLGWASNLSFISVFYCFLGGGHLPRKLLITGMAVLWGFRLSYLILLRVLYHEEDERYRDLRKRWGGNMPLKFFFLFQSQALLDVFLSLPFLLACLNPEPSLSPLECAGFILWVIALAGETLADEQLKKFKADPAGRKKTCRAGLWRYSRHPNYFFEWLVWCAYFVFALASPSGWLTVLCPSLMLYFLFRVSGIPLTEAQSLKSRGDDYREYQRTTSVFFPWFPKK